jgi:hypothetical protein
MQFSSVFLLTTVLGGAVIAAGSESVPVPSDPHELVTGTVQVPSTPADRATAFGLLERARQNADMHMPGMSPFNVKINFNATGDGAFTGPGSITELWFSGRQWRYDQSLGSYSETRISSKGRVSAKGIDALPLHVVMLRSAMFWPVGGNPSNSALRTAAAQWNGHPVTCLLLSNGGDPSAAGRLWEETEYCVDNASGLLQIYSRAPGTYVVYNYSSSVQFHGRQVPDEITIFVGGKSVLEGKVGIEDANPADSTQIAAEAGMVATPVNNMNMRFPLFAESHAAGSAVKPVIVNATIDTKGQVVEAEVSIASDPSLASSALDLVRKSNFGAAESWRQAYINVRFAGGN